MAEGIYELHTGICINSKARFNYAQWCGVKGTGMIPAQYRTPGAAVFWSTTTAAKITHVGYLEKPVIAGKPEGDWYIIEARGVKYGVVRTKLYSRKPNFWGLMTKYYDYGDIDYKEPELHLGDRTLKKGMKGEDVVELQEALIKLGYSCGSSGADGDFGTNTLKAVSAFQKDKGLTVDGVVGPKTVKALGY